jgi:hypothetical protein
MGGKDKDMGRQRSRGRWLISISDTSVRADPFMTFLEGEEASLIGTDRDTGLIEIPFPSFLLRPLFIFFFLVYGSSSS